MGSTIVSFYVAFFFFGTSLIRDALASQNVAVRKSVYQTPSFTLEPGAVSDKFYRVEYPKGHVGVIGFFAEVVDEAGNSVSLEEVYLHHWVTFSLHVKTTEKDAFLKGGYYGPNNPSTRLVGNSGVCKGGAIGSSWGLGSETRHTNTTIPLPYAMEIGNPDQIPEGFEEMWEFNVHAIDTRGVADRPGCTECRCDLYGVTKDEHGRPLPSDYIGGLECCYDGTRCKVKEGFEGSKRTLRMQYTIEWLQWSEKLVPLKRYLIDVTNTGSGCKIEYNTPTCQLTGFPTDCIESRKTTAVFPEDSILIHAAAHQHAGARGAGLYKENGEELCRSMPTYGLGSEPGNELGYVVGMGSCYPKPGSVRIRRGDVLVMESNYSTLRGRTGVMGIFVILVASPGDIAIANSDKLDFFSLESGIVKYASISIGFAGILAIIAIGIRTYQLKRKSSDGYQALST